MTDDELKALVAGLAVDSKNLHEAQRATDRQIKLNAVAQKVTEELVASLAVAQQESTRKLDKICELYGNVGKNQGDVAEEFFLNSLLKDNHLGSVHFDDVVTNMGKHRGQIQEEYDLVMTNGDAIGIVEVKYKAHTNDLDKLDRKMRNFKKLFPIYQNYKQYGAIASFHINDDAKKEALRRGYFVLQRSGDLVHTESGEQLTVL
ncbi:MAG: hypothetical protein RI893_1503 [Pseudomonadota bacterium]